MTPEVKQIDKALERKIEWKFSLYRVCACVCVCVCVCVGVCVCVLHLRSWLVRVTLFKQIFSKLAYNNNNNIHVIMGRGKAPTDAHTNIFIVEKIQLESRSLYAHCSGVTGLHTV